MPDVSGLDCFPEDEFDKYPWSSWEEAKLIQVVKYGRGNRHLDVPFSWIEAFPAPLEILHAMEQRQLLRQAKEAKWVWDGIPSQFDMDHPQVMNLFRGTAFSLTSSHGDQKRIDFRLFGMKISLVNFWGIKNNPYMDVNLHDLDVNIQKAFGLRSDYVHITFKLRSIAFNLRKYYVNIT